MPKQGYKQTTEHIRNHSGKNHGMFGKKAWNKGLNTSEETKKLIRDNHGDISGAKNGMYGKKSWSNGLTKKTDSRLKKMAEKLSGENNGMFEKGHLVSGEKNGMFERTGVKHPMFGKSNKWGHHTGEAKKLMKKNHPRLSGVKHPMFGRTGAKSPIFGKLQTEIHKRKLRLSTINYRKIHGIFRVTIGKHEKQILDEIAKSIGYRIIRQYPVIGYFVDGYVKEINLAIEVDEKRHNRTEEKDKIREDNIKKELNCSFIRISDY